MAVVLGDALRRLCVEVGWSYAVFWRAVGLQERRCLVWEDGYCKLMPGGLSGFEAMDLLIKEKGLLHCSRGEERLAEFGCSTRERLFTLVHMRMAAQVHVVGDGIVGEAASTGRHQWVLHGNPDKKLSGSMDLVEVNHQFLEGIRTIAVIPVLPQGVLQLGSTQQILEDIGFVSHVQHLFKHLGSVTGAHLSDVSGNVLNHKIEVSADMQPSVNQYGDVGNNITGLPCFNYIRDHQLFRCHDNRFITRDLPSFPSSCNKVPAHSQLLLDYEISRKSMLPFSNFQQSTCHLVKPNLYPNNQLKSENAGHSDAYSVSDSGIIEKTFLRHSNCQPAGRNGSLSPGHLKFLEKQFSVNHETTNESADGHEIMLDSSKLINLRSHEHELFNSLQDYGAISSLSGSYSLSKTNFENTSLLSSGTLECVKPHVSSNSEVSGMLSPTAHLNNIQILSGGSNTSHSTSIGEKSLIMSSLGKENNGNDLCQALDGPTETNDHGSGDTFQHTTCQGGWWCDSSLIPENKQHGDGTCEVPYAQNVEIAHKSEILPDLSTKISILKQKNSDRNLFDMFGLDQISRPNCTILDDSFANLNVGASNLITNIPSCSAQLDADTSGDILDDEISCSGLFSETGSDQLLDAIVSQIKPFGKVISDDNISRNTTETKTSDISLHSSVEQCNLVALSEKFCRKSVGQSSVIFESQTAGANSMNSECSMGRSEGPSPKDENYRSQISFWVGQAQNMNGDQMSATNCKRVAEVGKLNRKRVRPGENPRPRPKDRQMIQDRVKELREIIPNGSKLSIDALLEKTIKHMLFLQSVAKHADKLKETGKPKIISKDEGLLLKNFEGGATWAFEVGSESVICPIIVEDLSTPRHMLVEMLCEKRGLFLEIADLIRGLGLTILKGVMEARDEKVWARFAVEANRDITRMEVFLSLVPLLEPTAGNIALECIPNFKKPYNVFHQSSISATGASACP